MREKCPWHYSTHCNEECLLPNFSDPQRQRVYCFEECLHEDFLYDIEISSNKSLYSLDQCRLIIEKICTRYGIWPPAVVDGRGCKSASGCPECISLPRSYRDPISVVHETCHALKGYYSPESAAHGPIFMRFLITHLPNYLNISTRELKQLALSFEIEIAPKDLCLPPSYHKVRNLCNMRNRLLNTESKMHRLSRDYLKVKNDFERLQINYDKAVELLHDKLWPE